MLKYSLTWSTEGLINEYGNPCQAVSDGRHASRSPRSRAWRRSRSTARCYEAFNTSGGLGSLAETHGAHIESMNYKTIRYPGHCEQMRLLMNDLKLNHDRETLKRILENAVPQTLQDVVIVYAAVTGTQDGQLREENYVNKIYPQVIAGRLWSAIQVTTAAGITAVVDLVLEKQGQVPGLRRAGAVPPARTSSPTASGATTPPAAPRTSRARSSSPARPAISVARRRSTREQWSTSTRCCAAWAGRRQPGRLVRHSAAGRKSTEAALVNVRNPADGTLLAQVRPATAERLRARR